VRELAPKDEFAYKIMAWLNDHDAYEGGCWITRWGVLLMWRGNIGWNYRYKAPHPLPPELAEEGK